MIVDRVLEQFKRYPKVNELKDEVKSALKMNLKDGFEMGLCFEMDEPIVTATNTSSGSSYFSPYVKRTFLNDFWTRKYRLIAQRSHSNIETVPEIKPLVPMNRADTQFDPELIDIPLVFVEETEQLFIPRNTMFCVEARESYWTELLGGGFDRSTQLSNSIFQVSLYPCY